MGVHKNKQETFTLVMSRDELMDIKDAIGIVRDVEICRKQGTGV